MDNSILSVHNECVGCGACISQCPKHCIKMSYSEEGFLYPEVDKSICIECGKCRDVCPSIVCPKKTPIKKIYGGVNVNEEIVKKSSSGGIFFLLSEYVIKIGGYVCGVLIDQSFHVKHAIVNKVEDLYALLGSKYVQSDLGTIYKTILTLLEEKKPILFSGTPCQCAGLSNYLKENGADVTNLYLIEFICHGVPSPIVWEEYIEKIDSEQGSNKTKSISEINFRDKKYGWNKFGISFAVDGKRIFRHVREDLFYNGFIENLYLRNCCYECRYKGLESSSDISIADFWGSERYVKELEKYREKGISLITIFSEKGSSLFENITNRMEYYPVNDLMAYKSNKASVLKPKRNRNTLKFYSYRKSHGTYAALNKYAKYTFRKKIVNKIKWKIGEILGL